jgi:hypothetical protein
MEEGEGETERERERQRGRGRGREGNTRVQSDHSRRVLIHIHDEFAHRRYAMSKS